MKKKKLFFPMTVLATAVVAMIICYIVMCFAKRPAIEEHDFPFSITYELDGETVVLEDVYTARFTGNGGYIDLTERQYKGNVVGLGEDGGGSYILRDDANGSIYLQTMFYADYLLGDAQHDYFAIDAYEPTLVYYDPEYNEFTDEQTLAEQGVKLIDWEYPQPIENKLVFSKISLLSSNLVLPLAGIALLALLVIIIFVRRENGLRKKPVDKVSIILNFVIGLVVVPFTTIYAVFSDINGSSTEFLHQLGYIVPVITLLGLGASVGFRRKGFRKSSLAVQFAGPALFAVIAICSLIG